jgi:hypothetical protein
MAKHPVAANGAAPRKRKKALSMRYHDTSTSKAIDGAVSANLAKRAQIADPEVGRFGQLSLTRLSKAHQAKNPI